MEIKSIDEKMRFEDAYYAIGRCAEELYLISPNIPRVLNQIVSNLYGRFDDALHHVFLASNTLNLESKVVHLEEAHKCLFFQQSSLYHLVKAHGITIGQCNNVVDAIKEAYGQINRWKNTILKSENYKAGKSQSVSEVAI